MLDKSNVSEGGDLVGTVSLVGFHPSGFIVGLDQVISSDAYYGHDIFSWPHNRFYVIRADGRAKEERRRKVRADHLIRVAS